MALPDDQVLLQTLQVKDHESEIPILKALPFRRGYQASLLFLGSSLMKHLTCRWPVTGLQGVDLDLPQRIL